MINKQDGRLALNRAMISIWGSNMTVKKRFLSIIFFCLNNIFLNRLMMVILDLKPCIIINLGMLEKVKTVRWQLLMRQYNFWHHIHNKVDLFLIIYDARLCYFQQNQILLFL